MLYRIKRITDRAGNDKCKDNAFYRSKLGITLDMNDGSMCINKSCVMWCEKPSWMHSFITSEVVSVDNNKNCIVVTTLNSVYYLEPIL